MCYENLRNLFKPEEVRILFVGESRPMNGTFFYLGNSNLVNHTRQAFEIVLGENFPNNLAFLYSFRNRFCFLDDLCLEPVNHLQNIDRQALRLANIPFLAERLAEYQPDYLITTPMAIGDNVTEAVNLSGIELLDHCILPFPAQGHQNQYIDQLTEFLNQVGI